jgi:catechol 2,3-dioxygenase-like lactoylglutathione lyase family enzyme
MILLWTMCTSYGSVDTVNITDTKEHQMFGSTPAFSGFAVDDLDVAEKFYRDTLGLEVERLDMGTLRLGLARGVNVFVYPRPDHRPAEYTMLNFEVDDIDAAVDGLVARGVTMDRYDGFEQDERGIARGRAAGQGPDIAWFRDPAGNIIAVLSE